jgi:hypothetical protein
MVVVRVRVSGAPSLCLVSADGRSVLVRDGDAPRAASAPTVPVRTDGPLLERDLVTAAARAGLWAESRRAPVATDAVADTAAARVLRWTLPAGKLPPWLDAGLLAWVRSKAAPAAPQGHVCAAWAAPTPAAVAALLDPQAAPAPAAVPFLGRLVGALLEGRTDAPARLVAFADAPTPPAEAVAKAFGKPLADATAAALAGVPSAPAAAAGASAATCDAAGTVACPACAGAAKFQVACPSCSGTGAMACPSCLGSDGCLNCDDGWVRFVGGRKAKCKACSGGKVKCLACSGSLRAPCRACGGDGRVERSCLACVAGRMPCPDAAAGIVPSTACPWCRAAAGPENCGGCGGAGYLGCADCYGAGFEPCGNCVATGEVRMVYEDGTTASSSKCSTCGGKGCEKCTKCASGKKPCADCGGKGKGPRDAASCGACAGRGELGPPSAAAARAASAPLSAEETAAANAMVERAVSFLMTCRMPRTGVFALRKLRRGASEQAMPLDGPSAFANALALWTLSLAGRDKDDPELAGAWKALRDSGAAFVAGTEEEMGTQAAGLTLRALVSGGEDPKGPLVKGLVDRLCKAQRPSGFWGDGLVDAPTDDPLDTLFVAESLRVARVRGARVPIATWQKLLRGASSLLDARSLSPKSDWLIGSDVASAVALAIMAKEGSLGSRATAFDYASMPQVQKGMAWLDRHFSIEEEPQFSRGAKRDDVSDSGFMAWIFSVQRLGMLLRTEELGGRRWYADAVRHLRSVQYKDGSFEERSRYALNGALRTTCGALLFLLRATPPITAAQDD